MTDIEKWYQTADFTQIKGIGKKGQEEIRDYMSRLNTSQYDASDILDSQTEGELSTRSMNALTRFFNEGGSLEDVGVEVNHDTYSGRDLSRIKYEEVGGIGKKTSMQLRQYFRENPDIKLTQDELVDYLTETKIEGITPQILGKLPSILTGIPLQEVTRRRSVRRARKDLEETLTVPDDWNGHTKWYEVPGISKDTANLVGVYFVTAGADINDAESQIRSEDFKKYLGPALDDEYTTLISWLDSGHSVSDLLTDDPEEVATAYEAESAVLRPRTKVLMLVEENTTPKVTLHFERIPGIGPKTNQDLNDVLHNKKIRDYESAEEFLRSDEFTVEKVGKKLHGAVKDFFDQGGYFVPPPSEWYNYDEFERITGISDKGAEQLRDFFANNPETESRLGARLLVKSRDFKKEVPNKRLRNILESWLSHEEKIL